MGEFLVIAQSSIVLPNFRVQAWSQRQHFFAHSQPLRSLCSSLHPLNTPCTMYPNLSTRSKPSYWGVKGRVVSDSTMPTTFTVDSAGPGIDILPETGGGGDDSGSANGGGGGGGDDGGNNNNDGGNEGESDEGKDHNNKKKMALSMSQKLTLGYAFLVGAGGFMGYLKSGSTKSLIAGGVSASLLYSVYVMLPTQPVLASSMGFVLSAALLGVMGSRFLKSKKVDKALQQVMNNIVCLSVFDIFTLFEVLHQLKNNLISQVDQHIRMIIIDSISTLITPILGGGGAQGHALMVSVGFLLKRLAHEHDICILVTNHMVAGEKGTSKPALGESWRGIPHVRLLLSRDRARNISSMSVLRHPHMATGDRIEFEVQ